MIATLISPQVHLACQFTSKERDAETGLDFFGARYFSAAQGRFTSPDWSATPQPIPYADFSDPQTLNLYSYVRNNPLAHNDPDGHCLRPGVSCVDYTIGGDDEVANIVSDAATLLNRGINSLTGSNFPDAARFVGANSDQREGMQAATVVMLAAPFAEAAAAKLVDVIGTGAKAEATVASITPGADVPTSIPAGPSARPTAGQQRAINEMGNAHGCSTCGTTTPGTKTGNWVGDHQPPTALNPPGGAQVYQPQCLGCSQQQGGQVAAAARAARKAAEEATKQQ